jgi:hypothetical protein
MSSNLACIRVHQLFIDIKEVCDSVRAERVYTLLTGFGIPMKML